MMIQVHWHGSSILLYWLALGISVSVWLDGTLQLDSPVAMAFSINKFQSRCHTDTVHDIDRIEKKLQHPSRRNESFNSLLRTKQSTAADCHRHRRVRLSQLFMSTRDQNDLAQGKNTAIDGEPETLSATELQQRFEEAMQRRKDRRAAQKVQSSSSSEESEINPTDGEESFEMEETENSISPISLTNNEEEVETSETNEAIDAMSNNTEAQASEMEDTIEKDNKSIINDASEFKKARNLKNNRNFEPTRKPRQEEPKIMNDNNFVRGGAGRPPSETVQPPKKKGRRDELDERRTFDNYYDDDDGDRSYRDDPTNDYYGNERNDNNYDPEYSSRPTPTCEWETYRSTSILFPPLPQLASPKNGAPPPITRPKAIIHFVGGTFFGSYPRKFYGSLLEDIARKCNAVVLATPIPLVIPGKGLVSKLEEWMFDEGGQGSRRRSGDSSEGNNKNNPLDHVSLAETIQKEFNNAYRDVILDEYCSYYDYNNSDNEAEDFMKSVPIVGIGHSLGARIQAISCTHPRISKRYLSMGKGNRLIRSGRDGMIYLGFANWGASSSIPGVATLDRTVKKKKKKASDDRGRQQLREEEDRSGRSRGVGRRDDVWDDRSPRRGRRSNGGYGDDDARRRQNGRYYDRYDAEDLDLADVFSDVVSSVAKGAMQIGDALTPEAEDLEFTPTPNELWDDLSSSSADNDDGWYGRSCMNNLIVQFDEDPIDQGSRLARTLLDAYDAGLNSTNATTDEGATNTESLHDVKFARLPGGHLTPVTLQDGIARLLPKGAVSLLSSSYNFVLQQLDDERTGKTSQKQRREVGGVVDTVASYIDSLNSDAEL